MKSLNFSAGPSFINLEVSKTLQTYIQKNNGVSLIEISHRSKQIGDLFEKTRELIRELMNLDANKAVLFLPGGATMQYSMIAYNILSKETASIVDTGVWSTKCLNEQERIRPVQLIASGREYSYKKLPDLKEVRLKDGYLHITTNNTIYGTQYSELPFSGNSLITDMSSDILSRNIDFNSCGLIYAGLQKNLGIAGGALVVVDKRIIDAQDSLPDMLSYTAHINANSMFNTPPVLPVLSCLATLEWIKNIGGLEFLEQRNKVKASLLYKTIDNSSIFKNEIREKDRSKMNVVFTMDNIQIEEEFLNYAKSQAIVGIEGHRLVGGFRASIYNAMDYDGVKYLTDVITEFERKY